MRVLQGIVVLVFILGVREFPFFMAHTLSFVVGGACQVVVSRRRGNSERACVLGRRTEGGPRSSCGASAPSCCSGGFVFVSPDSLLEDAARS